MSSFLDSRLSSLKSYVPGEQPELGKFIKLNTNEFPYPAPLCVSDAAADAVLNMNLYSDLTCKKLKSEFEKVFGYGGNNVIFTNGSDDALYLCFLTFCGKDKGAAFADITYGFYSVYAELCGLETKIVPLKADFSIDKSDYFSLNKTIFIANPNAPTGLLLSKDEICEILENNKDSIVVIDEAYAEFSGQSCADLIDKYNNLIVVGTFSKAHGMAGARLGYIITNESIAADLEKVKFSINPYNVNSFTQAVGTAVLENDEYYKKCIEEICETRDEFSEQLKKIGFDVIPSKANFIFAKHDSFSGEFISDELRKQGILIRHFNSKRISDYVRITIGTPEQMKNVIKSLEEIVGGKK